MVSDTDARASGAGATASATASAKRIVKRGATEAAGNDADAGVKDGASTGAKGAKGQMIYLGDETREALKARAEQDGESMSAICDKALQRYLAGAAAASLDETAAPAIEEAVGRRLSDALPTALHPFDAKLDALREALTALRAQAEATHAAATFGQREAGYAHLLAFALLASTTTGGLGYAQETEGYAGQQVAHAVERGEIACLHAEVTA